MIAIRSIELPIAHATVLKMAARVAGAWVVAAELLDELFVPIYNLLPSFDSSLGRETAFTLACCLETKTGRGVCVSCSWHTSGKVKPSDEGARL